MSDPNQPVKNDLRHSWIENSFPPDKPRRWVFFLSFVVFFAILLGYLNISGCFPLGRAVRVAGGLDLQACKSNLSPVNLYGWRAFTHDWIQVPFLAILAPIALILLRRNRFNWLKKKGRWPKEWPE